MPAIDKNDNEIDFGDRVYYFVPGHGSAGHAYVAGEMSYSENGSHILLVNENEIGMPIHAGHCLRTARGEQEKVRPWRERYLAKWPSALKPLPRS